MTLRDDIHDNPACAQAIIDRNCDEIVRIMSIGRTKSNSKEIGNGTVLEVLGIGVGNVFLDVIYNQPDFRHVKPLVEQGRLLIGSALVQATIQSMVPAVLTKAQADKLCAVGHEPNPYTVAQIEAALYNPDGTQK